MLAAAVPEAAARAAARAEAREAAARATATEAEARAAEGRAAAAREAAWAVDSGEHGAPPQRRLGRRSLARPTAAYDVVSSRCSGWTASGRADMSLQARDPQGGSPVRQECPGPG